jgi:hypothetical protein
VGLQQGLDLGLGSPASFVDGGKRLGQGRIDHVEGAASRPHGTTVLRRRLLRLSVRLCWHPCWETVPSAPAARFELRQMTRAQGAVRAA